MIVFDLQCAEGHRFEGWFDDLQTYEDQKARSLIICPVCNESRVSRVPSTFAIRSSQGGEARHEALARIGQKMTEFVDRNFDDVGCDFAKEALKIHYGASEPRSIRGVSTPEEEKTLKEEGVPFFKFPSGTQSDTES